MKVWSVHRTVTILVGEDKLKPLASCQLFINGDKGYVYSAMGSNFFVNIDAIGEECKKYGVKVLEAPMVPKVASVLKRTMRDNKIATIEFGNTVEFEKDLVLQYVVIKFKD